jgi:hypothetical protein
VLAAALNAHAQELLDNVVELLLAYGLPQLPFLPRPDPQPTPGVRLTLRHTYEVAQPNTVTIVFESTSARTVGPDILQVRGRARLSKQCLHTTATCRRYAVCLRLVVVISADLQLNC